MLIVILLLLNESRTIVAVIIGIVMTMNQILLKYFAIILLRMMGMGWVGK